LAEKGSRAASENHKCLEGLECNSTGVCVKPDTNDGGVDDSGFDSSYPPDSAVDSGYDGGFDSGYDAGIDAGTDAGTCTPVTPVVDCQDYGGNLGWQCTVQAGCFHMGCNSAVDTECDSSEIPYHPVTVPAFKIDKYEVTVSQYQACNTASPSTCTAPNTGGTCNWGVGGRESHPINCVDWNQAKAYCTWAGKRLPSEAEWEKAARGTDGRKYPWGNTGLDCNHAVMSVSPCSNSSTATVGSKPAGVSPYGASDMIGNVWEWVEDDYHITYTSAPSNGSAWIDTPRAANRVLRGGAWDGVLTYDLRSSFRVNGNPTFRLSDDGFRCSRD
jgi:formylglycine-generating enzyme required for sulfatase activity